VVEVHDRMSRLEVEGIDHVGDEERRRIELKMGPQEAAFQGFEAGFATPSTSMVGAGKTPEHPPRAPVPFDGHGDRSPV
jgi:hypothetical protein